MPLLSRANRKFSRHPFWQADKPYLHDHTITDARFRRLGYLMAFSAGAINAGGFFAVASYTSHISGALSRIGDSIVMHDWQAALLAFGGVQCYIFGATHASWLILWGKRHHFRSCYGLVMWEEAILLLIFAILGNNWLPKIGTPTVLLLLCFIMGMHNTTMSLLSGGAIRSTHMTGSSTDLGIELSRALYYKKSSNPRLPDVKVNRPKMWLLIGTINSFTFGGIVGAYGYHKFGYLFTLPVVLMLCVLGLSSIGYDIKIRTKWWLIKKIRQAKHAKHHKNTI